MTRIPGNPPAGPAGPGGDLTTPPGPAELRRLEEILRSEALDSDAMAMDEVVGMLTALAMGPPMVQPSGWLPKVWGPDAEFESRAHAGEASGLLLRMWNAACGLTTADDYEGQLDRLAGLPGKGTLRGYCRGFLEGVDFDRRAWERQLAAAGLEEGLELVDRLAGEPEGTAADTGSVAAEPDRRSEGPSPEGPSADEPAGHWRHREELCGWLQAAHEAFRAARRLETEQLDPAAPRTYERSRPKIGRNDPCPCGSGKKYKRCCIDADPPPWETAGSAGARETVGGGAAASHPSADRASSPASPPTPPEPSAESSGRPADDEDPREIVERLMDRMLSGEWEDHFTGVVSRHLDAAASLLETVYAEEEPDLLEGEVGSGLYMWALEDFLGHTTDDDRNVVDEYLEQHGAGEPERARAYLEGLRDSIPGLYEVVSATPGERMVLEDLLWERPDIEVPERELSSRVEPGVRIACRLVELEDATYMGGAVLGLPDDWSEEVAESIDALIDEVFGAVAREGVVDEDPPEGPLQFAALRKGAFLFSSVWAARMLSPDSPSPAFEPSSGGIEPDAGEHGRCLLCRERFTRRGMSRHLASCLPDHDADRPARELLHLRVESGGPHWLHLEVAADARLERLDSFLRRIWLECCGHMSAFDFGGRDESQSFPALLDGPEADDGMERRLGEMVSSGDRFDYEYDFGTTTRLEVRVVASRTAPGDGSPLRLLARNEAPVYRCSDCDEPAVWICPFCSDEWGTWASPAFFCREHGREHSCIEELGELLPVVDSPRMGVCGYEGPAEPPASDRSR